MGYDFNEALDMLHEAFVDSESDYFIKRDHELVLTNGRCLLPTDHFSMIYVFDGHGQINPLDRDDDHISKTSGFVP